MTRINRIAMDGTLDDVDAVTLSVLEKGCQASPIELWIRRREGVRESVPCHNPLCNNGGLALGELLRELIRDRQTDYLGTNYCRGQEGDLEVPESLKSCQTRYEVQVTLRFR